MQAGRWTKKDLHAAYARQNCRTIRPYALASWHFKVEELSTQDTTHDAGRKFVENIFGLKTQNKFRFSNSSSLPSIRFYIRLNEKGCHHFFGWWSHLVFELATGISREIGSFHYNVSTF